MTGNGKIGENGVAVLNNVVRVIGRELENALLLSLVAKVAFQRDWKLMYKNKVVIQKNAKVKVCFYKSSVQSQKKRFVDKSYLLAIIF